MIDPQLNDKIAIVTGGNHGIGAAIAQALAAQGVAVFISYLALPLDKPIDPAQVEQPGEARYNLGRSQDASAVVEAIRAAGGRADAWEADLSDPATIPDLFDHAEAAFGPVDIVVNNAAYWEASTFIPPQGELANQFCTQWMSASVPLVSADTHDRHFAVNSRAVALMMVEFTRRHVARGADWGRIITISTDGAYGFPSEACYGASKLALESYSRAAAVELGQFGITVNIVSPGPIQTDWITAEMAAEISRTTPLKRVGVPQDIADVVIFLTSEQGRWLTGQTLHVGGGHMM